MTPTVKQMIRANTLEDLRRLWRSVTWLRRVEGKLHWFRHDYRFIRREARKAGLI